MIETERGRQREGGEQIWKSEREWERGRVQRQKGRKKSRMGVGGSERKKKRGGVPSKRRRKKERKRMGEIEGVRERKR